MARAKRHLAWQPHAPVTRAACGLLNPRFWTFVPAEVTCGACQRTVRMADAEVLARQNRQ